MAWARSTDRNLAFFPLSSILPPIFRAQTLHQTLLGLHLFHFHEYHTYCIPWLNQPHGYCISPLDSNLSSLSQKSSDLSKISRMSHHFFNQSCLMLFYSLEIKPKLFHLIYKNHTFCFPLWFHLTFWWDRMSNTKQQIFPSAITIMFWEVGLWREC